jgi:hypothetical protein
VWSWKDPAPGVRLVAGLLAQGFKLMLAAVTRPARGGEPAIDAK